MRKFKWICLAAMVILLWGCAEFSYRRLETEEVLTSTHLRENWNDNAGLIYKIRNDKNIQLSGKWIVVEHQERLTDSTVLYLTDVRKILGEDNSLYGYIVLPPRDSAFAKTINANTVEIIYNHRVQRIGR
jgi:hypothetical protein